MEILVGVTLVALLSVRGRSGYLLREMVKLGRLVKFVECELRRGDLDLNNRLGGTQFVSLHLMPAVPQGYRIRLFRIPF